MSRPKLEIADIFRTHGPAWRQANAGHVSLSQLKVMSAIEACRTEALGGHVAGCTKCGHHPRHRPRRADTSSAPSALEGLAFFHELHHRLGIPEVGANGFYLPLCVEDETLDCLCLLRRARFRSLHDVEENRRLKTVNQHSVYFSASQPEPLSDEGDGLENGLFPDPMSTPRGAGPAGSEISAA